MAELVLHRLPQPAAYLPVAKQGPQVKAREMPRGPKIPREALQLGRKPVSSSVSGAKVGATWLRNVPPQPRLWTSPGGTEGMWPNPLQAPITTANSRPLAFLPWPWTKTDHTESGTEEKMTRGCSCPFSKSWPHHSFSGMLWWGPSNNRWTGNNHINWFGCSGVQCELPVLLGTCTTDSAVGLVIGARGAGGAAIPYLGFVEVNLQIPEIANYNEDVLLLVIPTTTYYKMVPVVIGSKIIDRALSLMAKGEFAKAATMWRQAHFGAVMSGSLHLSCTSSNKIGVEEESKSFLSKQWPCGGEEVVPQWC